MARENSVREMVRKIKGYVDENIDKLPNLKECCLHNGWDFDELLRIADANLELLTAIKNLKTQREVNLEKGGIFGSFNKPMAAYLLEKDEREKLNNQRFSTLDKIDKILIDDERDAGIVSGRDTDVHFAHNNLHNNYDETY